MIRRFDESKIRTFRKVSGDTGRRTFRRETNILRGNRVTARAHGGIDGADSGIFVAPFRYFSTLFWECFEVTVSIDLGLFNISVVSFSFIFWGGTFAYFHF